MLVRCLGSLRFQSGNQNCGEKKKKSDLFSDNLNGKAILRAQRTPYLTPFYPAWHVLLSFPLCQILIHEWHFCLSVHGKSIRSHLCHWRLCSCTHRLSSSSRYVRLDIYAHPQLSKVVFTRKLLS